MGIAIGVASAILLFIVINLELPAKLDEMEDDVRSHTEGYKEGKTSVGDWIKSKFKRKP
jgi:hypothetical protein